MARMSIFISRTVVRHARGKWLRDVCHPGRIIIRQVGPRRFWSRSGMMRFGLICLLHLAFNGGQNRLFIELTGECVEDEQCSLFYGVQWSSLRMG